jgi:DNA repair exonuclease SbcCD ATPase subunit
MPDLNEVYKRIEEHKARRKEIHKMLNDELAQHERFNQIKEEQKVLRDEKKSIEQDIKAGVGEYAELEDLKLDIATDQELLSDIALNMYAKDEAVEITDDHDQTWYPVFKVTFKKSN